MAQIKPITKQKAFTAQAEFVTGPRGEVIETFTSYTDARRAAALANKAAHARAERIGPGLGFELVYVEQHWYLKLDGGNGLLPASDIEVRLWNALEAARAENARLRRAVQQTAAQADQVAEPAS